jgi:tripartite-type tricarboxylate transporter receptor subunit TctC
VQALAGQTIIVENKPGAAGSIAAEYTARAPNDGYTIFVHSGNSTAGNMWLLKNPPIDPSKDLNTIATINKQAFVLTVRHDSPYQNLADLVKDQKEKGEDGSYAVNATSGRVMAEEFKQITGLVTEPIQYGTAADSVNDMLAGHVDFGAHDPVFALSQLREGRWRALAIGSGERMAGLPDVPTFREQGFEINQLGWWGVMVPTATPADVTATINGWFNQLLETEDAKKFLTLQGGDPYISTEADAQKLMVDTIAQWQRLVEVAGLEPQ